MIHYEITANRNLKFWDRGHRGRQTCREPWVDTAQTLSQPSMPFFFEIDSYSLLEFAEFPLPGRGVLRAMKREKEI